MITPFSTFLSLLQIEARRASVREKTHKKLCHTFFMVAIAPTAMHSILSFLFTNKVENGVMISNFWTLPLTKKEEKIAANLMAAVILPFRPYTRKIVTNKHQP